MKLGNILLSLAFAAVLLGGSFVAWAHVLGPKEPAHLAAVENATQTQMYETLPAQPVEGEPVAEQVATTTVTQAPSAFQYVEVTDSCGPYYDGTCVNMRSGPGTNYPVVLRLRTGMILKVQGTATDTNGETWYQIDPGDNLRYAERITSGWYVKADKVKSFTDSGEHRLGPDDHPTTTKHVVVNIQKEMLYAYDGDTLFMEEPISTGLDATPTPRGTFTVYAMTPARYMQGPIPGISDQAYDLPGVPWNLYFTKEGAVIHGAYWHDHFGHPWSHGCVNLPPEQAKKLYEWAQLGMTVTIE